jgi:hypothetical protein
MTDTAERTYRTKTALGKLDGPYYNMTITPSDFVPICSNNKVVGYACVYVENGAILADLSLEYATEERLVIETRSSKLYAGLSGRIEFGGTYKWINEDYIVDFDSSPRGLQLLVTAVIITSVPSYSTQNPLGWPSI